MFAQQSANNPEILASIYPSFHPHSFVFIRGFFATEISPLCLAGAQQLD